MTNQANEDGVAGRADETYRTGAGLPRALLGSSLSGGGKGSLWIYGFIVPVVLCAVLILAGVVMAPHGPELVAQTNGDGP